MSRRTFPNARTLALAPLAASAVLLAPAPSALATFPGRNGPIAFYSDTAAGAQIFTVRPNGHDLRQITYVDGDAVRPDWSPDGRRKDWAPDGRHLAFIHDADLPRPGDSANIATIRPDGTDLRFLTHYQGGELNALVGSYSPDGRWIVFRLEDHGRFGLYKMHPDGSHLKPILDLSSSRPDSSTGARMSRTAKRMTTPTADRRYVTATRPRGAGDDRSPPCCRPTSTA